MCPMGPIIEKLGLTRYRIPQPPEMMHNIPKHYTTKGLVNGTVLKFDIRRPTNNERLWNKQTESEKNQTQECIIESHSEIRSNGLTEMKKKSDNQRENNQRQNQTKERQGKETESTNGRVEETHNDERTKKKNAPKNQQESGSKRRKLDPKGA